MKMVKECYYPLGDGKKLLAREEFNGDKRDGVTERWYENGQLWHHITYKNNKMNGLFEVWYPNGQLKVRETYKDDLLNGLVESWYPDGTLTRRSIYKNDKWVENIK